MMRCRAQPGKHTDWPWFTSFPTPSCLFLSLFLPLNISSSLCTDLPMPTPQVLFIHPTPNPSVINLSVYKFIKTSKSPGQLFWNNASISMTSMFLLIVSIIVCQVCVSTVFAFTFSYQPDFRSSLIRSPFWNKHSHTPLSLPVSATNQVCFWLWTLLSLLSQVVCICVWLSPFPYHPI